MHVQCFLAVHHLVLQVDEVVSTEDFDSIADVSLSANGDDNYVSVMEVDGFSGSVAGPMVIPAGKVRCSSSSRTAASNILSFKTKLLNHSGSVQ